ncbi:MAG: clostripain-related cysteine peptidase [Lachnospiraceae bacterium]|nr:clostripain-related cysteine peptidase [Lachnospiraceae bacterium]
MADNNRPVSHGKNVVGQSNGVNKRGSGLGTGPVGNQNYNGHKNSSSNNSNGGKRAGGGSMLGIIIAIVVLLLGGGGGLSSILGSSGSSGGTGMTSTNTSTSTLDTSVAQGSRAKRTVIKGGGDDVITIMVYMCGTDLESKYGMATADLNEMKNATIADNINIIVYTGGCNQWKDSTISSTVNQIYKVESGKLICLEKDMGNAAMTKPENLTSFIQYCTSNYPANRNELILWDHGGGSITGYGYDEKNRVSGSMTLAGINTALKNAGTTFDFIGFDACLMATVENGLMLTNYADYMIASEETEPGVGWYYTNWLTKLSNDTSMATIEIGKNIVDDFVDVCAQKCQGQQTTLSVVDLAELEATVPSELSEFAKDTNSMIQNNDYKAVSTARNGAREFARSSNIDQVDLVDFAMNLDTKSGEELADALKGCVKYNRTSTNMTNAYGLSIYFPYKKAGKVPQVVNTYQSIGMDDEYSKCIQEFASLEANGQVTASSSYSAPNVSGNLGGILGQMIISGLGDGSIDLGTLASLASGRAMSQDDQDAYIAANSFNADNLIWLMDGNTYKMTLPEDQWSLVTDLELNVFYDDGEGYIDLGVDNVFDLDDDGQLIGEYDMTWFGIDGQVVAFYHLDTIESDGVTTITSYVPAYLNGERVRLLVVFDNEHPDGYLVGANTDYNNGETEAIAKNVTELNAGDKIDFICDYYSYDGTYLDSYYLGDTVTVSDDMEIGYLELPSDAVVKATYKFTDIYQQVYWTPEIP